jgi:hypothetical protein
VKLRDSVPSFTHLALRQIEAGAVHRDIDTDPIGRVQDLGEVLGIAVFPPSHPRLVRIVDAGDVAALQTLARIFLLEIGALAHMAVAETEKALAGFLAGGVKTLLDDRPLVALCFCFHGPITVLHIPFPARTTRARIVLLAVPAPM